MKNYPFYIDREERPTFASQLRDLSEAFELLDKMKKGDKPKEDKKDDKKPSAARVWIFLSIAGFLTFPIWVWLWFNIIFDIISKAKHLPIP